MHHQFPLCLLTLSLLTLCNATPALKASPRAAKTTTTLIPNTCFNTYTSLQTYFSYLYPWGSDHNGAARMLGNASYHEYIYLGPTGSGTPTLTLRSAPPGQPDSTNAGSMNPKIKYFSGTVHATQQFAVKNVGDVLTFQADMMAPVVKGTWPAFWLTAVVGWPPEADLAEWKGNGDISFNTFNTSAIVKSVNVDYPNPDEFHTVKVTMEAEDSSNAVLNYYLDGVLQSTQYGNKFVGAAFWLILDLQMEGSSGTPGPSGNTTFQIRNLSVTSQTS